MEFNLIKGKFKVMFSMTVTIVVHLLLYLIISLNFFVDFKGVAGFIKFFTCNVKHISREIVCCAIKPISIFTVSLI